MSDICLYHLQQAGLLISASTGLNFFTLAGSPEPVRTDQEGFFIPLHNDPLPGSDDSELLHPQLQALFSDGDMGSYKQMQLDQLLMQISSSDRISVDQSLWHTSLPGWVAVTIESGGDFSLISTPGHYTGRLIWPLLTSNL